MKNLPREHGLIVSWLVTIVGAFCLANQYNTYGIALTILLLPSLFVYDRLIVGLRLWSIGKLSLSRLIGERLGTAWAFLLSASLACVFAGLAVGSMPWLPVLTMAIVLALEVTAFYFLRERHVVTRAVSILTITSQFLLINSGLTGRVDQFEVVAFILLSTVNVLVVVDVVELVEVTRIDSATSMADELRVDAPFLAGGVTITILISALTSLYYLSFVALLVSIQVSFLSFAKGRSIKAIGILSSAVEVVALALLLARFYGLV